MSLTARGSRWAVATPHVAASEAGAAAFEAGGNAIDAALAAATTLAVVYPQMCGVGGDLFALVEHPAGDVVAVTSVGRSAVAVDVDAIRAQHGAMPERGPLSIVVPGAPGGWEALHRQGAALPWGAAFERAERLAADGAPVAAGLAETIGAMAELLRIDDGFASTFFRDGAPLAAGEPLRQPALAATLAGLAAGGADALYRGPIGAAYAGGLRELGSPLAPDDLAAHGVDLLSPLSARFRDLDVRTSPPTSQGFSMLAALLAIDRLGIDPDPFGPDAGTLALAFAAVARDRDRHLADPTAMRVHPHTLLDDGHVAALCDEIRAGRPLAPQPTGPDTAGLVTADAEGYAVSLIQSLAWEFGSGILEPRTGVVAQNRGSAFVLDAEHPNVLAPSKRPAHTLMPVLAHRDGRPVAVSGTMGGPMHPQINAWSLIRSLVLGMTAADAVAAPRWLAGGMDDEAGRATAETGVPDGVVGAIEAAGFRVARLPDADSDVGHAHLIRIARDGGFEAGADPRADGAALAG